MPTPAAAPFLPVPLPVSFGPHEADWWMVWVTAAGVIVSLVVAISAVIAARSARDIALRSENARVSSEANRISREYQTRLDDALAALLTSIADHFGPLRDWQSEVDDAEMHNRSDRMGDLLVSTPPALDAVDTRAQIVRMVAIDGDAEVAREISHMIAAVNAQPPYRRDRPLQGLVHTIREWRAGERPAPETINWLRQYQRNNNPNQ